MKEEKEEDEKEEEEECTSGRYSFNGAPCTSVCLGLSTFYTNQSDRKKLTI